MISDKAVGMAAAGGLAEPASSAQGFCCNSATALAKTPHASMFWKATLSTSFAGSSPKAANCLTYEQKQ